MSDNLPDELKVRLYSNVILRDLNGKTRTFTPNDEVPQWARDRITNPKAWGYTKAHPSPAKKVDAASDWLIDVVCHCHHVKSDKSVRWFGEDDRAGCLVARFERSDLDGPEWLWVAGLALGPFGDGAWTDSSGDNIIVPTRGDIDSRRRVRTKSAEGPDRVQLWCSRCGLGPRRGLWETWAEQLEALYLLGVTRVPDDTPKPCLVASIELSGLPANL